MKARYVAIILTMLLVNACPLDLKAQRGMVRARVTPRVEPRVTPTEAPLSILSEIPIIGRLFPQPAVTRPIHIPPPATPEVQRAVEKALGTIGRNQLIQLTPYGLTRPYNRRSPFTLESGLRLPPEIASLLNSLKPADRTFSKKELAGFQLTLRRLGYDVRVDGTFGPQTREAIKLLQREKGYRSPGNSFVAGNGFAVGGKSSSELFSLNSEGPKYANGNLDEETVSYLNLISDLRTTARKIYSMDSSERTNALDRSKVIRGYAEYSDHFDIYYQIKETRFVLNKTFGNGDFGILRYYPKYQGLDIEVIDPLRADREFLEYCKTEMRKYSNGSIRLVTAMKTSNGYRMLIGDHVVELSARDMRNLRAGQPLTKQNVLATILPKFSGNFVFWRNPLMQKSSGELRRVEELAFGLQRAYPKITVSRSSLDSQKAVERISALNSYTINSPNDVLVVLDRTSRITDYKIVDNLRPVLADAGIPIVEYSPGLKMITTKQKAVIVITGHMNKALKDLVRELSKDGYFAGNFVLLNSCNDANGMGTRLIDELLAGGAQAVMRYRGKITTQVVWNMLTQIAGSIKSGTPTNLHDLQLISISGTSSGIFVTRNSWRGNIGDETNQVQ